MCSFGATLCGCSCSGARTASRHGVGAFAPRRRSSTRGVRRVGLRWMWIHASDRTRFAHALSGGRRTVTVGADRHRAWDVRCGRGCRAVDRRRSSRNVAPSPTRAKWSRGDARETVVALIARRREGGEAACRAVSSSIQTLAVGVSAGWVYLTQAPGRDDNDNGITSAARSLTRLGDGRMWGTHNRAWARGSVG
jgi:hypothetical protein